MNKQKQGFTLVELIVVITILAILGTIAIMAFSGYSKNARDSRRTSDLNNITKVLELFKLKTGTYPSPTDIFAVTYSGATAWTQGNFGDATVTNVATLDKKPVDPLTGSDYTYSVTNTKGEFQIAAIYEGDNLSASYIPQTYAAETVKTIVKGTYNGKFVKTNSGSTTYILGAPSIITSEITSVDIETIANNKTFVYTNYNNLPSSYRGTAYTMTGGFDFGGGGSIVLFEGDILNLGTSTGKLDFANNLNAYYSVPPLDTNGDYKEIVDIDTVGNPAASISLINNYLTNKVGGVVASLSSTNSVISNVCNYQQADIDALNVIGLANQASVFNSLISFVFPHVSAMGPRFFVMDLAGNELPFPLTLEQRCNDVKKVEWGLGYDIPPQIFTLNRIVELSLPWNSLTTLTGSIGNLTNLTNLNLSNNQLTSLPSQIGNLTNLVTLTISDNQISTLPAQIGNLGSLKNLYMSTNAFSSFPSEILSLTNLESFEFSYNSGTITSLPAQITNLNKLQTLSLDSLGLTSFPTQILTTTTLQNLSLNGNTIASLPGQIGGLTALRTLSLSNVGLASLPGELVSLINLESLELSYNDSVLGTLGDWHTTGTPSRSQSGIPIPGKTMTIAPNGGNTKIVITVTP